MTRLHVEEKGKGAPVLFLHGLAGSARNWRPQLRALPEGFLGLAFDARGHARSEAPEDAESYGVAVSVADALDVLAGHAGPGRPAVWVGLSMGAVVALEAALRHPEAVAGLVLVSYPGGRERAPIRAAAEAFAADLLEAGMEAAGARHVWGPDAGFDPATARLVRQGFLEHTPHGLAQTLRRVLAVRTPLPELPLGRVDVPTLVVAGERDAPSLPACRALAEGIPGARLEVVPGAGHVVNLADRDAFSALLAGFLHALPGAPAPS